MAKTWVLDTEAKGTGAHIAPLPGERGKPAPADTPLSIVQLARPPRAPAEEDHAEPERRFKLVDIRSARVLGEDLDLRAAMDELGGFTSPLDVRAYLWLQSARRWRLLTL